MHLNEFQYELPKEHIARFPVKERTQSRLMVLDRKDQHIAHRVFSDVLDLIQSNDLLVCNNSKVIPARVWGEKASGGKIEMLIERILDPHRVLVHIRASKSPKPGSDLFFKHYCFKVLSRQDALFELQLLSDQSVLEIIELIGEIPLPPYFERQPDELDKERYQTIYADPKGSVAAPTAGLHFDERLFENIRRKGADIDYVTLHVGAGTFQPVRVEDITQHKMHAEYIQVSSTLVEKIKATKAKGGRVIAVGTTTLRSLETASLSGELMPFEGDTDIFIYPGFSFKTVDVLITNFHLPGSTLLMLVSAFAGQAFVMKAYQEAIAEKYRFFSYGDAMWIG